ncbi:MAG: indolepyruvate ferredoxin oxidoreductase family protein [Myxococcota bacterium]
MSDVPGVDTEYRLDDRYTRDEGRVYLTGTQALVRLPLLQAQRDRSAGLNTAGFISVYRGSPLAQYDLALWQAKEHLDAQRIYFEPGVNEELAATAVWGSQLAADFEGARYDGVFGIWYAKGPGVDRAGDALKHANYAGTSRHGGVVLLVGDDPAAESSSIAHQSEPALVHMGIPCLVPASVQEFLDLGLHAFAMSRYSGCYVAMKCVTDTVESAASVQVGESRVEIREPSDHAMDDSLRRGAPVHSEEALYHARLEAVTAYARANRLDRLIQAAPQPRIGIAAVGRAAADLREALGRIGFDTAGCEALGLVVYQVSLAWPLEPQGALAFASDLEHLLVLEEKRPLVEDQLRSLLYARTRRPEIAGKRDRAGERLVPDTGALGVPEIEVALRRWLGAVAPAADLLPERGASQPGAGLEVLKRLPAFCAGCPHNRSTKVPEGSLAGGGIGCHGMAAWMPSRKIALFSHMGGEGAQWIGIAPFSETEHIFQNLGDGTYFHSGLLAIRANVVAGTKITYKILNNGGVAMTGGQLVEGESIAGEVTTPEIARQLLAEGVLQVAVVSDEPEKYPAGALPPGVRAHPRRDLDRIQRELREIAGVTALVYDQTCAAEARRLRRRGEFPDPDRRVVIAEEVCEGCGDCGLQSNCIAIDVVETKLGRKRRIDQSACNKDFSCVDGHCPSFVSVLGGRLRARPGAAAAARHPDFNDLPEPVVAAGEASVDILVAGIGGSGVVTLGALLGMAAHLEGKGVSVLDVTGLSQKNGAVTSHVRIAASPEVLTSSRIVAGGSDLLLACDPVVAAAPENLETLRAGHSHAVVNRHVTPTSALAEDPDLDLSPDPFYRAIREAVSAEATHLVDATRLATALCGDALFGNPFLLGVALQSGQLPVGRAALERAIELNGRAVEENKRALGWGRLFAVDPDAVRRAAGSGDETVGETPEKESLASVVADRSVRLVDYQGPALAARYRALVERCRLAAEARGLGPEFPLAVAKTYARLLAYKDEYEVARLLSAPAFREGIAEQFEGKTRLVWHAAPPRIPILDRFFDRRDPETGRTRKIALGGWVFPLLGGLARFRFLRGTPFDLFGRTAHRRLERRLIEEYEGTAQELISVLEAGNEKEVVAMAEAPLAIRGFDSVKEESIEAFRKRNEALRAALRLSSGPH